MQLAFLSYLQSRLNHPVLLTIDGYREVVGILIISKVIHCQYRKSIIKKITHVENNKKLYYRDAL
jgi:hypothetical protein